MDLEQFKSDIIPLRPAMFIYALKIIGNEADAEDVVQETLLRAWSMRERLEELNNSSGFCMTMVKNACIDKIRLQKQTVDTREVKLVSDETPYGNAEKNDCIYLVKQIIEALPELQRLIIRMRDIEGYELEEIASITGTKVSAVTMNLSRARKKVREEFLKINAYKRK
jgi:RNA polymerase sigma factor, sigma-70 family